MFFAFKNRLQSVGDHFFEEITCRQFFLIICLYLFHDEAPTISDVADIMGSSHQNVKQLVTKPEKAGFVFMLADSSDRRKLRVYPTEKLNNLNNSYAERSDVFLNTFYKNTTDEEISRMLTLLKKLEQNLVAMNSQDR